MADGAAVFASRRMAPKACKPRLASRQKRTEAAIRVDSDFGHETPNQKKQVNAVTPLMSLSTSQRTERKEAKEGVKHLSTVFASAVTAAAPDKKNVIAKNGTESIYGVLSRLAPQASDVTMR